MFPDDPKGGFDKYPKNKSGPAVLRLLLSFPAQVVERLLHGLAKPLPESSRVKAEEFLVKRVNCPLRICHAQFSLIAVWNTYKTGPLIHDEAGKSYSKGGRKQDDDDEIDRMRKQAAPGPQGVDDRTTSNDPRRDWEHDETDGEDLPWEISHFRVRAVEQTIH